MFRKKEEQPIKEAPGEPRAGQSISDGLSDDELNPRMLAQGMAALERYDEKHPPTPEQIIKKSKAIIEELVDYLQRNMLTVWGQTAVRKLPSDSFLMDHYRNLGRITTAKTISERREAGIIPFSDVPRAIADELPSVAESDIPMLAELVKIIPDFDWRYSPDNSFEEAVEDGVVCFEEIFAISPPHIRRQNRAMTAALEAKGFDTPSPDYARSLFVPASCLGFWIPVPLMKITAEQEQTYLDMVIKNAREFQRFFQVTAGQTAKDAMIFPDPRLYTIEPWLAIKTKFGEIPAKALTFLSAIAEDFSREARKIVQDAINLEIPLPKNEKSQSMHFANTTDALNLATIICVISRQMLANLDILGAVCKK